MDTNADESRAGAPRGGGPGAERHPTTPLPDWVHDRVPLEHPLAILDLETTGTSPEQDRIVEIAILKIEPEGRRQTLVHRVNPEMPIPPGASAVHGITDADVAREPTFRQLARSLTEFLADCDLAGFNLIKFDLPLLRHEFERAGMPFRMAGRRLVDALTIYHQKEPRNLSAAFRFYCDEELAGAHSAEADVRATYRVLLGQLRRYRDLPQSMDALHLLCNPIEAVDMDRRFVWQGDEVLFNFGKCRGQLLRSVLASDRGYLEWIANETDMSGEVRRIVREALQGVFPVRSARPVGGGAATEMPGVNLPMARQEHLPFPPGPEAAGGSAGGTSVRDRAADGDRAPDGDRRQDGEDRGPDASRRDEGNSA